MWGEEHDRGGVVLSSWTVARDVPDSESAMEELVSKSRVRMRSSALSVLGAAWPYIHIQITMIKV